MQDQSERNSHFDSPDMFGAMNHYFLLFFGTSCLVCSIFMQQLFVVAKLPLVGISASSLLGIVLPLFLFTSRFPAGFRRQMRLFAPQPAMLSRVIVAGVVVVVVIDYLYLFSQLVFPVPEDYLTNLLALKPRGAGSFIFSFAGLCLMVPLAEELLFRGVFQQILARNMSGTLAFLLAGMLFGVAHFSTHLLLCVTAFGIFLSYIFYATGNVTYTIIAHAIFNAISFAQLAAMQEDALSQPPFYTRHPWMLAVSLLILVWMCVGIKKGAADAVAPRDREC
jgi:membrane protease YdiL (CAAX protease family)